MEYASTYTGTELIAADDLVMAMLWSGTESSIAIICACLPASRRFFAHMFSSVALTSRRPSDESEASSQSWYAMKPWKKGNHAESGIGGSRIEPMVLQTHNLDLTPPEVSSEGGDRKAMKHSWHEMA